MVFMRNISRLAMYVFQQLFQRIVADSAEEKRAKSRRNPKLVEKASGGFHDHYR